MIYIVDIYCRYISLCMFPLTVQCNTSMMQIMCAGMECVFVMFLSTKAAVSDASEEAGHGVFSWRAPGACH